MSTPTPAAQPASPPAVVRVAGVAAQNSGARTYKAFAARTAPTNEGAMASQVEKAFASLISTKGGDIRFRLDPAELGPLNIAMRITGDRVSVRLGASTPLAHELLNKTKDRLRAAMESRGLSVERIEIAGEPAEGPASPESMGDDGRGDRPPDRSGAIERGAVALSGEGGTDAAEDQWPDARGDRPVRLLDAAA